MTEFDDATHVEPDGSTSIVDGWDINGNANGGYLMALAARGLRQVAERPDPISVTAHYLSPGKPGPVQIDAEVVKSGRRFATVVGRMHRDGVPLLQLVGAFGDLSVTKGGYEHNAVGPPELPPFEQCVKRSRVQGAVEVTMMDRLDVRIHPDHSGWVTNDRNGVAEMAGWFAFADGRPIDTLALLMVCDAFPPAVFHLDMPPGWVPTVEYTVHVRGVPAPGAVRCVFRSQFVQGGFLNEDGEVWDSAGRLVAQSRQLGLTPLT
ncbi:MAG TPA: thioesterase family protein [Ilumatobacteraceae bacterium]|nr:thioesterase family protein [Ilumatobacteraceae bacterium]